MIALSSFANFNPNNDEDTFRIDDFVNIKDLYEPRRNDFSKQNEIQKNERPLIEDNKLKLCIYIRIYDQMGKNHRIYI